MIKLEEVTKKYRISKDRDFTALKGINLSINQGNLSLSRENPAPANRHFYI